MNLLLLDREEILDGRVRLTGRRAEHLRRVLGVEVGQSVRAGIVGGGVGTATVTTIDGGKKDDAVVELTPEVPDVPAECPRIDLVLGLPRPQALKRILEYAAMMGVARIDLIRTWRVEKSFFHTPLLEPERLRRHLLLGAEQGMTTWLPEVGVHHRFKPYLDALAAADRPPLRLLAHPEAETPIEAAVADAEIAADARIEVAVGPEGGLIDREVASFAEVGFQPVRLGPWILRVETALAVVLGQLELLRRLGSV